MVTYINKIIKIVIKITKKIFLPFTNRQNSNNENITEQINNIKIKFKQNIEENLSRKDYNAEEKQKEIIEIYKSYFSYIISIQARRWKQHTFYFTIYSLLTYIIFDHYPIKELNYKAIIQISLSLFYSYIAYTWYINLIHIKHELHIKYKFIQAIEELLPIHIFKYEFLSAKEANLHVNSDYELKFIKILYAITLINFILIFYIILMY